MVKKDDLPAMPFYWGDWFKSMDVQSLPRDIKCVWFEMLGRMWESNERGYLTINDKPMTDFAKASALGFGEDLLKYLDYEKKIEEAGLFSRRKSDGAIFSIKILKLVEIRLKRQESGRIGGSKTKANAKASAQAKRENENEYETETINESSKKEYFLGIFNTFLPPELQSDWCAYLDYCYERGDIKLNRPTITEQAKFLREHQKDAKKIMRESIKNNWKGLFEVKDGTNERTKTHNYQAGDGEEFKVIQ